MIFTPVPHSTHPIGSMTRITGGIVKYVGV